MNITFLVIAVLIYFPCADSKLEEKTNFKYPMEEVINSLLDNEQLNKYLHPKKDRIPLVITGEGIEKTFKLKKFGKPVIVKNNVLASTPHLNFTIFECKFENYCNLAFEYSVEGIQGSTGVIINPDKSIKFEKMSIYEK